MSVLHYEAPPLSHRRPFLLRDSNCPEERALYVALVWRGEERFVEDFRDYVQEKARGMTKNRTDAENIASDTLTQMFRGSLKTYDPTRPLRPWINTAIKNKVRDMGRKRGARIRCISLDNLIPGPGGPNEISFAHLVHDKSSERADAQLLRYEDGQVIREVADKLPPTLNDLIYAIYFGGMTFREYANLVGISIGTAKSRCHAALNILRDSIGRSRLEFSERMSQLQPAETI